ncbi:MAG TPA: HAMP domain-containing sensor histidine kinase [Byssovorax sp.]|jgi:signal transduction histidine kinase
MSLRQRLAVVLALGLSALVIAALAIGQIWSGTQASRERAGEAEAEAAAQALADALPARLDAAAIARGPSNELKKQLHQLASSVMRPVPSSVGGYCTERGALLATSGRAGDLQPQHDAGARLHPMSGELETAVAALCQLVPRGDDATRARVEHAKDVEVLRALPIRDGAVAWALVRVKTQPDQAFSSMTVALAVAALLLVGFTVEAMIALGRGVSALRRAASGLAENLDAPVPKPAARELADVARGLEAMAARLSAGRARERDLAGELAREQRLAALGRVAAGIAHEVRNPLAGMKLRLDLLKREGGLSAQARDDVTVCLGEVARLDRLVESLMSVGRTKNKRSASVDLAALVDARVSAIAPAAGKKRLRIAREGSAVVMSEPDALAAALENLLRNAIDASEVEGAVRVKIEARPEGVALTVEDEGPGIPEDRVHELFEPFFTTKPDGTGLGLWMSRLLLEARGAALSYHREGGRTCMRIVFSARTITGGAWQPS